MCTLKQCWPSYPSIKEEKKKLKSLKWPGNPMIIPDKATITKKKSHSKSQWSYWTNFPLSLSTSSNNDDLLSHWLRFSQLLVLLEKGDTRSHCLSLSPDGANLLEINMCRTPTNCIYIQHNDKLHISFFVFICFFESRLRGGDGPQIAGWREEQSALDRLYWNTE